MATETFDVCVVGGGSGGVAAASAAARTGARTLLIEQGVRSGGPDFGTRESRHIESLHRLTWPEIVESRKAADAIGLGAWGVEWHDRKTFDSTFVYPPDKGCYDIPLGCLISADTPNLFAAGRVVDANQQAGASVRVMGTAFATGQAAGIAAACFAQAGRADANDVRRILLSQGAMLDAGAIGKRCRHCGLTTRQPTSL